MFKRFLSVALILCAMVATSDGATLTAVRSGDYNSGSTWDTGGVPTAADAMLIDYFAILLVQR